MNQVFNIYGRQLTEDEIRSGEHRELVGGMWDELGALQLDFLVEEGLLPTDTFLDVGCGALRGGVRFIEYLDVGHYCGMDINASLINAGLLELENACLTVKRPKLLVDDCFSFEKFGFQFDFALAQSVFTHLPQEQIVNCLAAIARVLKPEGEFFATYFDAPTSMFVEPLLHEHGGVVTYNDHDPFHYSLEEFSSMASRAGLTMRNIGDWNHPRDQRMLGFSL